jgi:hypothetical protein
MTENATEKPEEMTKTERFICRKIKKISVLSWPMRCDLRRRGYLVWAVLQLFVAFGGRWRCEPVARG